MCSLQIYGQKVWLVFGTPPPYDCSEARFLPRSKFSKERSSSAILNFSGDLKSVKKEQILMRRTTINQAWDSH